MYLISCMFFPLFDCQVRIEYLFTVNKSCRNVSRIESGFLSTCKSVLDTDTFLSKWQHIVYCHGTIEELCSSTRACIWVCVLCVADLHMALPRVLQ